MGVTALLSVLVFAGVAVIGQQPVSPGGGPATTGVGLICAGAPGIIFEITPEKKVVWQYNLPTFGEGRGNRNVFRAIRIGPDFPGLRGRALTPGKPLVEMAP